MGYTHIELLPVMEHPFSGSWGYQVIGFFAPTSRFGTPEDFKAFVDACHQAGIGVILDWVPGHFPKDAHGLARFDGTALYEHADPRQGEHQDWGTLIFNYGRNEVRSFLLTNALFWLEEFHIDGLRVDAVASMLYLDYSRKAGEWVPNQYGGRENLEAIDFLKQLNARDRTTSTRARSLFAEESTLVARRDAARCTSAASASPTSGTWAGCTTCSTTRRSDPVHRKWHHNHITFSLLYAFSENFVLPFSHDEVVHGKRSMLDKMPGDVLAEVRQRCARSTATCSRTRARSCCSWAARFGQWREWNHDGGLDWDLLGDPRARRPAARGCAISITSTRRSRALWQRRLRPAGFAWIDCNDHEQQRRVARCARGDDPAITLMAVVNFTPVPRHGYRIGVPVAGT